MVVGFLLLGIYLCIYLFLTMSFLKVGYMSFFSEVPPGTNAGPGIKQVLSTWLLNGIELRRHLMHLTGSAMKWEHWSNHMCGGQTDSWMVVLITQHPLRFLLVILPWCQVFHPLSALVPGEPPQIAQGLREIDLSQSAGQITLGYIDCFNDGLLTPIRERYF